MSNPNRYGRPSPRRRIAPGEFGSGCGHVTCSYAELVRCFGQPTYVAPVHERVKVAIQWKLEDHVTGNLFSVYEWKSTTRCSTHPSALSLAKLRRLPEFRWSIGAGKFDLDALRAWMSERLGREVKLEVG